MNAKLRWLCFVPYRSLMENDEGVSLGSDVLRSCCSGICLLYNSRSKHWTQRNHLGAPATVYARNWESRLTVTMGIERRRWSWRVFRVRLLALWDQGPCVFYSVLPHEILYTWCDPQVGMAPFFQEPHPFHITTQFFTNWSTFSNGTNPFIASAAVRYMELSSAK